MEKLHICVLAAGRGSRLKTDHPKAMAPLAGKSFIKHVLENLRAFSQAPISLVIGAQGAEIQQDLSAFDCAYVEQKEALGTAHAVRCFLEEAEKQGFLNFETLLLLYCDAPLFSAPTLKEFYAFHRERAASMSLISTQAQNPEGLGRVVLEAEDQVLAVVEEKDLEETQKSIRWTNAGFYLFEKNALVENIAFIQNKNKQKEYLITDLIPLLRKKNRLTLAWKRKDGLEFHSANDFMQIARMEKELQDFLHQKWMKQGVCLVDPENTYIEEAVEIGRNCVIFPHVSLKGCTQIQDHVTIEEGCIIKNSVIEAGSLILGNSYLEDCWVKKQSQIGPMAVLLHNKKRENT